MILKKLNEHCEILKGMGYEVVAVFLQGSQNYELETDFSDYDTKAIVLPTFDDFVMTRKPVSQIMEMENGQCDVKDIRIMFENFLKSNINFLEILFTKYKIISPEYASLFQPMIDNAERIATWNRKSLYNSIAGMTMQKFVALKHPYPSLIEKIENIIKERREKINE